MNRQSRTVLCLASFFYGDIGLFRHDLESLLTLFRFLKLFIAMKRSFSLFEAAKHPSPA